MITRAKPSRSSSATSLEDLFASSSSSEIPGKDTHFRHPAVTQPLSTPDTSTSVSTTGKQNKPPPGFLPFTFQSQSSDSSSSASVIRKNIASSLRNKTDVVSTSSVPAEEESIKDVPHAILDASENDVASEGHSLTDDGLNQVVISISWGQGKVGAAFYDISSAQVYMVEDVVDTAPDFWVLRTLFREQNPKFALVGGRQDERLFRVLRELCGLPSATTPEPQNQYLKQESSDQATLGSTSTPSFSGTPSCTLRVLPMSDFKYELCLRRVMSLVLPGEPEGVSEIERELFVRGRVNTDLIQMTRALGALIRFIDKHGAEVLLSMGDIIDANKILGLHVYAMEDLAHMDDVTTSALQLFSEDQHPAASKSGKSSASKEGLSIYALLSRTSCAMSAHVLRRILLRPLKDPQILTGRYALVAWGVEPINLETVRKLQNAMKMIINVPRVMNRLRRGHLTIHDWKMLHSSLFHSIVVGEICQAQDQYIPIFKEISESMTDGIYYSSFLIQRIMDVEQSQREGRFVVKPGVHPELDEKKRRYSGLADLMHRVAATELRRLPPEVDSCSIVYIPHVGYLLAISSPSLEESLRDNDYNLPGLKFMFKADNLMLYKSFTCCEMDRELGDIQVDIANHETRIMMRLVENLLQQAQNFLELVNNILILDCLLAFSVVSRECGWVKPELTDEPVIDIENARHPLYELCTPTFVANPIKSGNTQPYITLVTGPNSSGKTVYLKQVGVLAVLAQIGCWVPASSARLKPLAAILAVTHAMPPVISSLSSFMLDLSRMCSALDRATRHSLIIIDEFGATTYETDGAALLTASLDYWCQRTRPRYSNAPSEDVDNPYGAPPHVFVSTHLHQVYAHLQYQDAVRCLILETVEENGGLVPLYQVSEGRATKSYASAVAALAGVPPQIVTRSTHILHPRMGGTGHGRPIGRSPTGTGPNPPLWCPATAVSSQVCESIRSGKLPDRWELVKNEKERTRCEIIASMFISYDLNDPVEILFNKIQAFVASRKGVSTPASGIFTESSTSVTLEPGSNSEFTRSDTVTSSVDSKIGMNISCFNSFLSSSKKKSRKGKKSAALQSTSKHDHEEQGPSGIPLNWNVEAILSSGSSSHADLCRDSTST